MTTAYGSAYIHPEYTLLGRDRANLTPEDAFDDGLGVLLDRIAKRLTDDATVLLAPSTTFLFHYPHEMPDEGIADHPILDHARERGWKVAKLRKWTSFVRDGQVIHVGMDPACLTPQFPLWTYGPWEMMLAVEAWRECTGKSWHGTPGIAGMSVLRGDSTGKSWATWRPTAGTPEGASEADYKRQHWTGVEGLLPDTPKVGYDANRMYLAAAANVRLHPWTLKNTGAIVFDKKLAGWWLVEGRAWTDPRIPDPSGRRGESEPKWVTSPTVELMVEADLHVRVLDSWTGPGTTLMKPWATKLEAAWHYAEDTDDDGQAYVDAVRRSAKSAYRWTVGSLNSPKSTIFRPDWHYSVIAMARANLWRRAWRVGQASDRWPIAIDVDNLIYADNGEVPDGLVIGDRLGQFKVKEQA